jgi:hypothetical protein
MTRAAVPAPVPIDALMPLAPEPGTRRPMRRPAGAGRAIDRRRAAAPRSAVG